MHFDELLNIAQTQVFATDDWVRLVIIAVIVIAGGFFMSSFSQILNTTVVALIIYVAATMVRTMMSTTPAPDVGTLLQQDWDAFLKMDVEHLLVWFLSFAILIGIVHGIRSLVLRG